MVRPFRHWQDDEPGDEVRIRPFRREDGGIPEIGIHPFRRLAEVLSDEEVRLRIHPLTPTESDEEDGIHPFRHLGEDDTEEE